MNKNKLGYTLGEIVMTTAIIGSLAAIAVPNFLRIKMNVNMEMVKQHLKVVGQNLNELYNQSNPHEFPANIETLGNTPEELSITASLNAISGMGYTNRTWLTSGTPRSTFSYRVCPGEGLFGIAGDRCFLLTPSELTEVMPWEGSDLFMTPLTSTMLFGLDQNGNGKHLLELFLNDPNYSQSQKEAELLNLFRLLSFQALVNQTHFEFYGVTQAELEAAGFGTPSFMFSIPPSVIEKLEAMMPNLFQALQNEGINISYKVVDYAYLESAYGGISSEGGFDYNPADSVELALIDNNYGLNNLHQFVQVSVQYQDSITYPEAMEKARELDNSFYRQSPLSVFGNPYGVCSVTVGCSAFD